MQKIIKSLLFASLLLTPVIAPAALSTNYDTAVELARVNQIDNLVKRITDLNARAKQYMLSTGDIDPTVEKINTYFGIASSTVWKNYDGGILALDTSLSDSLVVKNIFQTAPTSIIVGYYKNSPMMDKLAITNVDYSELKIPYDTTTYGFIKTTKEIIASGTATISRTEPTDKTKLWYKPVGDGTYEILKYDTTTGKWKSLGKTSTGGTSGSGGSGSGTIVVGSVEELNALPAKSGDMAMVSDGKTAESYVYDGTQWVKTSTGSNGGLFNGTGSVEAMATTLFSKAGGSIVETVAPFGEYAGSKTFTKKDDVATGGYWISADGQFVVVDKIGNLDALDALFLTNTIAWTAKAGGGVYALQKRTMPNAMTVWVYLATDYADVLSRLNAPYKNNQGQYIYSKTHNEYFHQLPSLSYIEPISPAVTFIAKSDRATFSTLIPTGRYLLQSNDCTSTTCNGLVDTAYYAGSTIDNLYAFYYSTTGNRKNNLMDAVPRTSMTDIYNNLDAAAIYGGYVYLKDVDNRGRVCYKRTTGEYVTKANVAIPTGNNMPPASAGSCSNAAYSGSAIVLTNRTEMVSWTDAPLTTAQVNIASTGNTYTFTAGASDDHYWKSAAEWVTNGSRSDFDMASAGTTKYLSRQVGTEPNYTGVGVGVTSTIDPSFKEWFYSASGTTTQALLDAIPINNNPYDRAFMDTIIAQSVGFGIKNGILGRWIVTGALYNSPAGETAGIWKLLNDQSKWLTPSFTTYANVTNAIGVAKNGLLYNSCNTNTYTTNSATAYCASLGMRMPSFGEVAAASSNGVPSCSFGFTRTSSVYASSPYGDYYYTWNDTFYSSSWGSGLTDEQTYFYSRCVK